MPSNSTDVLLVVAMVATPLVMGVTCIAAAIALGKRKDPNDPAPRSTGNKVVTIALGCTGLVLLALTLGIGACFGTVMMQG